MNWLDLAILGSIAIGALMGMWVGVIRAAFTAAGVVLGILMAGHFRGNVEALVAGHVANDTLITVLGYAIIILTVGCGAVIAGTIVRKLASMLLLGWVDKAGGMALGLVAATLVSSAAIVGLVGVADSYELPSDGLAGTILEKTPRLAEAWEGLRKSLDESVMVSVLAGVTDTIPVGALAKEASERAAAGHNLGKLVQ